MTKPITQFGTWIAGSFLALAVGISAGCVAPGQAEPRLRSAQPRARRLHRGVGPLDASLGGRAPLPERLRPGLLALALLQGGARLLRPGARIVQLQLPALPQVVVLLLPKRRRRSRNQRSRKTRTWASVSSTKLSKRSRFNTTA